MTKVLINRCICPLIGQYYYSEASNALALCVCVRMLACTHMCVFRHWCSCVD